MIFLQFINNSEDFLLRADKALVNTVLVPMIIWIVLMLILLLVFMIKYPLKKTGASGHASNPYEKETMAIPRGMIRGVLSITILIGAVLFQIYALRFFDSEERISSFMTAFEIMLGFYFGSKVVHHLTSADRDKVKEVANAKTDEFVDVEAEG